MVPIGNDVIFVDLPQKALLVAFSLADALPGLANPTGVDSLTLETLKSWKVKTDIMRLFWLCLPPGQEGAHALGHGQPRQRPDLKPGEVA